MQPACHVRRAVARACSSGFSSDEGSQHPVLVLHPPRLVVADHVRAGRALQQRLALVVSIDRPLAPGSIALR